MEKAAGAGNEKRKLCSTSSDNNKMDSSSELKEAVAEIEQDKSIVSKMQSKNSSNFKKFNGDLNSRITCTACYNQIIVQKPNSVYRHPVLHVLLCRKCYEYYTSGEIRLGEDGVDEQCRWCGEGGKLILCDDCSNTFCRHCIKQNLGRAVLADVTSQEKWRCFICDPTPLADVVESCTAILEATEAYHKQNSGNQVEKNILVRKNSRKNLDDSSSINSSLESDEEGDFETVFGSSDMNVVVKYLKSSLAPLQKVVTKADQQLARNKKKSALECQDLKKKLVRTFGTLRKTIANVSSMASQRRRNGSTTSVNKVSVKTANNKQNGCSTDVNENGSAVVLPIDLNSIESTTEFNLDTSLKTNREDMEAQRQLHRELFESDDDDNKNDNGESSDNSSIESSDTENEKSDSKSNTSDDEFDPKSEFRNLKETLKSEKKKSSLKLKSKTAVRQVKQIRERIKMNKLKHEKSKLKQKKLASSNHTSDEDEDANSSTTHNKSKTKSIELSPSKQSEEDSDGSEVDDVTNVCKKTATKDNERKISGEKSSKTTNKNKSCESTDSAEKDGENMEDDSNMDTADNPSENVSDEKDSDAAKLDKEIEKLEKMPKVYIKLNRSKALGKVTLDSSNQEEDTQVVDAKQKNAKSSETSEAKKDSAGKRAKRLSILGALSGDEKSAEEETEPAQEEIDSQPESMDIDAVAKMAVAEVEDEDEKARRALLAEDDNGDVDEDVEADDDVEDDSDLDDKTSKEKEVTAKSTKKTKKKNEKSNCDSSEDDFEEIKKKKLKSSKLLRAKLSDSDEESETNKKKTTKIDDDEESDVAVTKSKKRKKKAAPDSDVEKLSSDDSDVEVKKKRSRIKKQTDSSGSDKGEGSDANSDDDDDDDESAAVRIKRKKIRKIITQKELSKKTVSAAKAEEERRERIAERQKLFNQVTVEDTSSPMKCMKTTKLVLEIDEKTKETIIEVHKHLICKLKPHQVEAVKFMWNCCIESLERSKKEEGSGCILAHCMGLGKTLSVIAFVHTLLANADRTKLKTCLVLCPLNTILNWQSEFERWLEDVGPVDVYEMSSVKDNWGRSELLRDWQSTGGVMIMGYEMFRNLSQSCRVKNKKQKKIFTETLLDPGPDLVVCDEGHVLKNDNTRLSKATNQVKSKRRIILTGTPLQNNLKEYHCMVNFVKPSLLGSLKEFCNRFVNPIMNGQCSDSSAADVKLMKRRAHILHDLLAGCVQRKDYSALTKFLPPKHEYVISVRLAKVQIDLYDKYLERLSSSCGGDLAGQVVRGARIFTDYQNLMKIWTHPWVLKMDEVRQEIKRQNACNSSDDSFIDDYNTSDEEFIDDSDSEKKAKKKKVPTATLR